MQQTVIPVEEFKKRLDAGSIEFIFDLRVPEEFASWRIEGTVPVQTINIPQLDFVGEEEKYFSQLPRDKEIIIICAHGDASKYSAELLQKEGFRALSLEGGMDAWSEFYEVHRLNDEPAVYQIHRVARGCICHVLASGGEAVVIDPARHTDKIMALIDSLSAKVVAVIDTHLQADHISGGRKIAADAGADYLINPADAKDAAYDYKPLEDGLKLRFGKSTLSAIHSPGHTPGSVSLLLDGKFLFTGDTIMVSSIGRPDLGGMVRQWAHLLYDTLFHRYEALADDTVILPSHIAGLKDAGRNGMAQLTLGSARAARELFHITDEPAFIKRIEESLLENPARYQDIRKVNLGLIDPDETRRKELEIGKNLCGMAGKKAA